MNKKNLIVFVLSLIFFCVPSIVNATIPAEINDSSVRIRSGAGTNNSILYTVGAGTPIELVDKTLYAGTGCSAKWYKVIYKNQTGYTCSAYVTLLDTSYSGINVVDYTARVNSNNVNVRKSSTVSSSAQDSLSLGVNVQILGTVTQSNSGCTGNKWYKIRYYNDKTGYICARYVTTKAEITANDPEYASVLRNAGFPDTYIPYLTFLHQKYPAWNFVAKNTNLNFATAVDAEEGKNYMQTTNNNYRTSTVPAEGSSWFRVNSGVIAFYMDPRNWLTEERMFMFEKLDYEQAYDSQYPTLIKSVFNGGALSADQYTIPMYNSGKKYQISPLHLASRIRLEVGANGSASTSGGSFTYEGNTYSGYYNFFNIGAYEKNGYSAVVMGLVTAMNNGWNTIEKAIDGGAQFLANGYINQGQGTLYYQKFNVRPKATYSSFTHQYMTNIQAPATEGNQTYNSYANAGILTNSFIFEIPIYKNMPDYTSLPGQGDTNNLLKSLSVTGHELSPLFDPDVINYEVEIPQDTTEVEINAQAQSIYATISNTGKKQIDSQTTDLTVVVKPQVGEDKRYTITFIKVNTNNTDPNTGNNTDPNAGNNTDPGTGNNNTDPGTGNNTDPGTGNNNTGNNTDPNTGNNTDPGTGNNNTDTNTGNNNPGENTTTPIETIVSSSNITTNNTTVTSIKYNTKVQTIIDNLTNNGASSVIIKNAAGTTVANTALIGTGFTITISNGQDTQTYTFVIKGDTSGDGIINTLDLLQVYKHVAGDKKLTGAYLSAGDTSSDNTINTLDLLQVYKHVAGDKKL